jgi:hypothetical protein
MGRNHATPPQSGKAPGDELYPFGKGLNDSPILKHIGNYSNDLMPRADSAIRNGSEVLVVLMRGHAGPPRNEILRINATKGRLMARI